MFKTKMIDMAKSLSEAKDLAMPSSNIPQDRYPYGLCISLDNESLEKLGLDCECEVGDLLHGQFMAEVTSVSKHDRTGQATPEHRIELQIKFLSVLEDENEEFGEEKEEENPVKKFNYKDFYKEQE